MNYTIRDRHKLPTGDVTVRAVDSHGFVTCVTIARRFTSAEDMHTIIQRALRARTPRLRVGPFSATHRPGVK